MSNDVGEQCPDSGMSDSNPELEAEEFSFDGGIEAWIKVIETSSAGCSGDVLLLFSERRAVLQSIENWAVAASMLVDQNNAPAFTSFCFMLAPFHKTDTLSLREGLSKAGVNAVSIIELATAQRDELHAALSNQPARTAVCILGVEKFRGEITDDAAGPSITSWTGISHRMRSVQERHRPHLRDVVRSLLEGAQERALFITAICSLPNSSAKDLVDDLGSPEALLIIASEPDSHQRMTDDLVEIMEQVRFNKKPLEVGLQELESLIPQPDRRALARSQLLFGSGQFEAAWQAVEPYLESYDNEFPTIYLNLSHAALAALRQDEAIKQLNRAFNAGVSTLEDLQAAFLLAHELKQSHLSKAFLEGMKKHFPNAEVTLALEYKETLRERNFDFAEIIARKLHLDFEAEMWSAFARPTMELNALEEHARKVGKVDQFAIGAAIEFAFRGDHETAAIYARMVSAGSKFEAKAVCVRIRAFGSGLLGAHKLNDDDIEELLPLMEYVSLHPSDQSVRAALDKLFEETIDEMNGRVLLGAVLNRLIPFDVTVEAPVAILDLPSESEVDAALDFIHRAWPIIGTPVLALGVGLLPLELRSEVTPQLINALLFIIQEGKYSEEHPQHWMLLLMTMELICLEEGDPSRDLIAAQFIIQRLAASGGMQAARNLAEETLRALPARQPSFFCWRLGLAWIAFSEAFARSGNAMAALRTLCLAMVAVKGNIADLEVFCTILRICTRVQRDVGLIPLALETIRAERKLRTLIGATGILWQLAQVELTLRISEASSKRDFMVLLLESMRQLRALPHGVERLPLVAPAISLLRKNRLNGVEIQNSIYRELETELKNEVGYYPTVLRHLLHGCVTKSELISLISMAGKAIRLEDMASQYHPLQLVAEDAIEIACDTDDADLFVIAASLQCQPALALRAMDQERSDVPTEMFRRWALEELAKGKSAEQIIDLNAMMRRVGDPESYSLLGSCETTIIELSSILVAGEAALLAADGASGALCICIVFADGRTLLRRLGQDTWSGIFYNKWLQSLHNGYGRKSAPSGSGWSRDNIRISLKGISLGLSQIPEQLIVLPHAALFGFPFAFTDAAGEFLGLQTRIAIAPSASWLVSTRQSHRCHSQRSVGWLGSRSSGDQVIRDAHTYISPQLTSRGVQVVGSDTPEGLAGADLAVVLTHGVMGDFSHFRSVTDGRAYYAPADIAEKLVGCGCVVLLVCYGAHAVVPSRTNETRGLLAALLAVGVRCVIASAWPVTLETIQYWLPTFLDQVGNGLSVGEAAFRASREVDAHVRDAAAWGSLQVFGDANLLIKL